MANEANEQAIEKLFEAFSSGELDALDELCDPGFVDRNPEPDQPPGIAGVKAVFVGFRAAFPDLKFAPEKIVSDGDYVTVRATMSGTHQGEFMGMPATGKSFSIMVMDMVRFADGMMVERWGAYDAPAMMAQLGVAPPGG